MVRRQTRDAGACGTVGLWFVPADVSSSRAIRNKFLPEHSAVIGSSLDSREEGGQSVDEMESPIRGLRLALGFRIAEDPRTSHRGESKS